MSVRKAKAGHAEVTASIRDKISGGLKRIKAKMQAFSRGATKIGGQLFGAGAAGLAPMVMGVKRFLKAGDNLNKMSARTNASTESLSTMGFAATETGADLATLERGFIGMTRTVRNAERGLSTATAALDTAGISLEDLEGKTPDEQFKIIADGLKSLDVGKRAAVAMEIFGKSGQKLIPMLNEGSEGIERLQQNAKDLGLEVSTEDANKAAELTDRLFELKEVVLATGFQMGAALAPTLITVVEWLTRGAVSVLEFIRNNRQMVVIAAGVFFGLMTIGGGLIALGTAAGIASFAVSGLITLLGIAGSIFGAIVSPIGLVAALLIGGVAAWLYYSESGTQALSFLQERLGQLLDWGKMVFGGVYDAIRAGDWGLAGKIAWTALQIAWQTGIGWIQGLWIDFKFGFLSVFDMIVSGFRRKWIDVSTFIGKGIIWLIDQANTASEAISGMKIIDVDTDSMRTMLDEDNDRFQKKIFREQMKREQDRIDRIDAAKEKLSTKALNEELKDLVAQAAEKRAAIDAAVPEPEPPKKQEQLDKFQAPTIAQANTQSTSALGSFSLAALSVIATRRSVEKQNADANMRTAEATEGMLDELENGDGLVVT